MGRILSKLRPSERLRKVGKFLLKPVSKKVAVSSIAAAAIGAASIVGAIEGPKWHRLYVDDSLNRANAILALDLKKNQPSKRQKEIYSRISGYLFPRYVGAMEVVKKQTIDFIKNASRSKLDFFIKARSEERQELQKIIKFGNSAEIDGKRRGIKELKNLEKFYDFILNEAEKELKKRPKQGQKPFQPGKTYYAKR